MSNNSNPKKNVSKYKSNDYSNLSNSLNFLEVKIRHQTIAILKINFLNAKVTIMTIFQTNTNMLEGRTMCQIIVEKSNICDNFSNSSKSYGKNNTSM